MISTSILVTNSGELMSKSPVREKIRDKAFSQLNYVGNTGWWTSTATIYEAFVKKGIEGLPESAEDFSDNFLHSMAYYHLHNRYVHAVDDNAFSCMWIFISNHSRKTLLIDKETLENAQQSMWALFRRTWLINSGTYQQSLVPCIKPAPPTTAPPATVSMVTVSPASVLATATPETGSDPSTKTTENVETVSDNVHLGTVLGGTLSLPNSERRSRRSFVRLAGAVHAEDHEPVVKGPPPTYPESITVF